MDGRVGGLKLEIFDVSEPAAPTSVTTYVLGADWNVQSEALYDHKAFMYFPARQLLAIPVSRWDADNYHYGSYRSELHVFRIDDDRKSTRLNSSHVAISYAVFCLKKKTIQQSITHHKNK